MSIEIKITIPERGEGLDRFKEKMDRLDEMWAKVEQRELELTFERFSTKKTPDGAAWPANKPLTLMLRRGGSMMSVVGRLKGSITASGGGLRYVIEPHTVYAAIHQFGGTIVPKKGKFLRIPIGKGTRMSPEMAARAGVETTRGRKGKDGAIVHGKSKSEGGIFMKSVTIPKREYLGIGAKDREMIEETVREWFAL